METALAPLTLHRPQPLEAIAAAGGCRFRPLRRPVSGVRSAGVSHCCTTLEFVVATNRALACERHLGA